MAKRRTPARTARRKTEHTLRECPGCGKAVDGNTITDCPCCGEAKCPNCDMGDDVGCVSCDGMGWSENDGGGE